MESSSWPADKNNEFWSVKVGPARQSSILIVSLYTSVFDAVKIEVFVFIIIVNAFRVRVGVFLLEGFLLIGVPVISSLFSFQRGCHL